jgi:hypothetical protein
MHVFLSYNRADREVARRVGAQLRLVSADVWLDEWEIRAGDSIPGKVNDALATVDTVIVIWSSNASRSKWVRAELETAIQSGIEDESLRVIPVILDDTPLPPLIRRLKWVDLRDEDEPRAVNEIMGFAHDRDRMRAIQQTIDEAGVEVGYFPGHGPVAACPRCGAGLDKLRGWEQVDEQRDDLYGGVQCTECGFSDGAELF